MNKIVFLILFPILVWSQVTTTNEPIQEIDSLYREDQFYFSLSYNLVQNRPAGFKQFSFSPGITAGVLRDMPITKNRHWAIASGMGYSYNNIKQFINSEELLGVGTITPSENIRTTIIAHGLEFPLEIRWRNSTPLSHKFWRIYTGFKATYILDARLNLETSFGKDKQSITNEVNRWQFGAYITAGFNTWNPYIYYGINPIFKDGSKISNLNIGFQFYIL
jgi:hypothetical protein